MIQLINLKINNKIMINYNKIQININFRMKIKVKIVKKIMNLLIFIKNIKNNSK